MAATRRLLERVPADRLDWKPHPKSRSLGELATHVTELPRWGIRFLKDSFQVGSEKAPTMADAAAYVARFDENAGTRRVSGRGEVHVTRELDFSGVTSAANLRTTAVNRATIM